MLLGLIKYEAEIVNSEYWDKDFNWNTWKYVVSKGLIKEEFIIYSSFSEKEPMSEIELLGVFKRKYERGMMTFPEFCLFFGYDNKDARPKKAYKFAKKEQWKIENLFSKEELDHLLTLNV